MRLIFHLMNLAALASIPLVVLGHEESTSHAGAIYRGWRANLAHNHEQLCGFDLRVDAGQPFVPGLETAGRWASVWVGNEPSGPQTQRYRDNLKALLILAPTLCWLASWLAAGRPVLFAPWIALALWLSPPNMAVFNQGDVEITLIGPVVAVYLAGLGRMHVAPGVSGWLAVAASSWLGWRLFPLEWLVFFLPATVVWLTIAWQHRWWWHGLVVLAAAAGAAPSIPEWHALYRLQSITSEAIPMEFRRLWLIFNESTTQLVNFLAIHAMIGAVPIVATLYLRSLLAIGGGSTVVCAFLMVTRTEVCCNHDWSWDKVWSRPALPAATPDWATDLASRCPASARVLCEASQRDATQSECGLPMLNTASPSVLIGSNSDADASPWVFVDGQLNSRELSQWTDGELSRIIERWNVGWIITQSAATNARLGQFANAIALPSSKIPNGGAVYQIQRKHRYILRGSGNWAIDQNGSIILTDLVPESGEVILSLRYHKDWATEPAVVVDAEIDPYDAWPIVRLRLPGRMNRLVLKRNGR